MFSLRKLKLKNWCQHKEREFIFAPGTNGIIGANGRGKSNILAAAFTMLTGKTLVDTLPEAINYSADSTENELTFDIDGTQGVIKREFTAPRKDENPNNRGNVKSTASLKYGKEKLVKGVSPVNAALDGLAGFSTQMLQTHVFITQDKMSELLFQPAQERLKSFMALIPDLNRAEKIRASLMAEMGLFPDTQLAVSSAQYEEALVKCASEIKQLELDYAAATTAVAAIDVVAAQAVIEAYNRGSAVNTAALETQLTAAEKEYEAKIADQGEYDLLVQQLEEVLPDNAADRINELNGILARADATAKAIARKQQLESELNAIVAEVETLEAPVSTAELTDEQREDIIQRAAVANNEVASHLKVLEVLAKGGECPTCGNKFSDPEKERVSHEHDLQITMAECSALKELIDSERQRCDAYARAMDAHKLRVHTLEQKLLAIQSELSNLDVPESGAQDIEAVRGEMVSLVETKRQLDTARHDSEVVAAQLVEISKRIESLTNQIEAAKALIVDMPSQAQYNDASTQVQQYGERTAAKADIKGTLDAANRELGRLTMARDNAQAIEERNRATINWKNILESARSVLHRDELPEEVLASYIGSLEAACNKFLGMFGNPFAVMIGRSMDIRCTHPNGYVASARRLSAGQKCVLSVAMRFAINELFAGNFGLIILDEPTAFMDDDNIEYMRELITYIRGISQTTGIQTIIITHHKELISSFDNVISV